MEVFHDKNHEQIFLSRHISSGSKSVIDPTLRSKSRILKLRRNADSIAYE